jgi:hypothetical protein
LAPPERSTNGPCGHGQSATGSGAGLGGGGGPRGGVSVPGAQPRIGDPLAGHLGAAPGQASQGSTLASRRGLTGGVRGGYISGGPGGRGGATERARASPYPEKAHLSFS